MNEIRLSFLQALANTTRFNLLRGSAPKHFDLFWIVIVRMLLGFVYAFIASFFCWILRFQLFATILGTIAILIVHRFITGAPEENLPEKFRRFFISGDNTTADLLANLTIPMMIFLTILGGDSFWMPAILALGTTVGIEFSSGADSSEHNLVANWKCWAVSAVAMLIFAGVPCLGDSDALRAIVLRGFFLFVAIIVITYFLRNTRLRTTSLRANTFVGTVLAFLLALVANAL